MEKASEIFAKNSNLFELKNTKHNNSASVGVGNSIFIL